jgi:energy-coupling factor transporter ATP-binding protein EcfA2
LSLDGPFVGLRPFRPDEALLFFGRRQQTMELLDRLDRSRLLAVVGSSGCGKSSLVFAGLLPQLEGGFLVENRDRWTIVRMAPGERPLARLAAGLGLAASDLHESGAYGILGALHADPDCREKNWLVVVDQFEELFRFAGSRGHEDEAAEFVRILLDLVEQRQLPLFLIITMRSDFLGDCDRFRGLPEALNRSQYLVPRLTRQQLREAIEGPTRLFGGGIEPRLVDRVLNEAGDDHDQLPILQHAMLRTWERAAARHPRPRLDVDDYVAVGGMKACLAQDSESAFGTMTPEEQALTERVFKALTDTDHGNRRVRRPARASELARITGAPREQILDVIERFRGGGRSFLVLHEVGGEHEAGDVLVDISHEALIRNWDRLRGWVDEEAQSKRTYLDLVDAVNRRRARLHDSDLQVALEWRARVQPRAAWAERYAPGFEAAMAYLDASLAESRREEAEARERQREAERSRRLRWWALGSTLAVLLLAVVAGVAYARAGRAGPGRGDRGGTRPCRSRTS